MCRKVSGRTRQTFSFRFDFGTGIYHYVFELATKVGSTDCGAKHRHNIWTADKGPWYADDKMERRTMHPLGHSRLHTRNKLIIDAVMDGETITDVACRYGLARKYVSSGIVWRFFRVAYPQLASSTVFSRS